MFLRVESAIYWPSRDTAANLGRHFVQRAIELLEVRHGIDESSARSLVGYRVERLKDRYLLVSSLPPKDADAHAAESLSNVLNNLPDAPVDWYGGNALCELSVYGFDLLSFVLFTFSAHNTVRWGDCIGLNRPRVASLTNHRRIRSYMELGTTNVTTRHLIKAAAEPMPVNVSQ